ncbi:hypothetical protein BsWGS_29106 [Bradybaena similaris]
MLPVLAVVGVLLTVASHVLGHGRLMDPPARNSMWRLGFPNPVNYNDNELYCGGRITQWARNKGKCGVCGDPHHHTTKDHEVGGKYANGIISRQYTQGDVIEVTVHITANHKGYFEFRICPVTDPKEEVTQDCLDQHVLEMVNGEGSRYHLPEGKSNQFFNVSLRLPTDVTCKQCVIQWKYRTGNTWDKDDTGKFCVGCGPQEEFYNCADVTIHAKESKQAETPTTKDAEHQKSTNTKNEVKHAGPNIVFTDDAYKDEITDYGKQKAKFINKLQTNKYSTWNEPEKSISKVNEEVISAARESEYLRPNTRSGISVAHTSDNLRPNTGSGISVAHTSDNLRPNTGSGISVAHTSDYSKHKTGSDMRFGYLGDDYTTFNFGVKESQPSAVTHGWKSDNLNKLDIEDVRSRFGFASSTKKKHSGDARREQISKNQLQPAEKNALTYGEQEKDIRSGKEIEHRGNNGELQRQTKTDSHSGSVSTEQTTLQPNVKTTESEHNSLDKAMIKLHAQLRDILHNAKVNPQQRDSFLRRWKLLRLREIASRKALNASSSSGDANSRSQLQQWPQKSRTTSNYQVNGDHDKNMTPALKLVTDPSSKGTEKSNRREIPASNTPRSLSPATAFAEARKSVKQVTSRQTYLKHKLPSWLVTTLKLKHQGGEESSDNFKKDNKEILYSENGVNKHHSDQQEENSDTKWYNKNQRNKAPQTNLQDSNTINKAHKYKDTAAADVLKSQEVYKNAETQMLDNSVEAEDTEEKMSENDASANVHKTKESGISESTESLVRYIVKLLLARKHSHDKSASKSATRQSNSDKIKTSEKLEVESNLKDNETDSISRSVYSPESVHDNGRNDRGNHLVKQHINLYINKQVGRPMIEVDNTAKSSSNAQPLVRAEAQPFNGLILGSEFSYSQDQAKKTNQNNQNWEPAKTYPKEDSLNAQIKNVDNTFRRNGNHVHQQTSYAVSYAKPFNNVHYQNPVPQTSWFNSQVNDVPENAVDSHHIWSARALNRQGYYNNKQATTQSRLRCRSLVTLGGGMDQWCTDNCNSNFCPPSMCVCMPSLPTTSVYASDVQALPVHYSASQRRQQIGTALTNHGASEGTYRNPGYVPEASDYVTRDVSSQGEAPVGEFIPDNRDVSYIRSHGLAQAPSVDQAMVGNTFYDGKDSSSLHSINPIVSESHHNRGPLRMYRSGNTETNVDHSVYANPFYSQYLEEGTQHRPTHIIDRFGQRGVHDSLRNGRVEETHIGSLPYISNNIMRPHFPVYNSNADSSISTSWLPNSRPVLESDRQRSILRENLIKPFVSQQNIRHSTSLSRNDGFSRNKAYALPQVVGQSFVGQNQFYPQFKSLNDPNAPEIQPILKCKAIGAYAGLAHFDEWCHSTCQSTMCPLLICSCDN